MKLTRPFQWRGGKALIAKELLPHFAKADHYVEPFFGGGGMYFAIPDNIYKVKTVNDINKNIVTFFKVLRTRTEELIRVCEYTPYSRDELESCIPDSEDELEQARRVWVRGRQGWLGEAKSRGDWGTTRRVAFDTAGKTEAKLQALREYAGRLRHTSIDNMDAFELIEQVASPTTFLYMDPPYICDTEMYENGFTEADHRRLAEVNKKAIEAGASIAISGYPSPIYDELYKDWNRLEFQTHSTSRKKREKGDVEVIQAPRTEVLWMSYPKSKKIGNPDKYLKPKPLSNLEKALLVGARS